MPVDPATSALALTVALVAVATVWDLRTRRIPNWLTVPLAFAGLLLHAAAGGPAGAWYSAVGCLAGLAVLLVPCFLRWVGAGDVKLLGAVGALQGPALVLRAGLYGVLAGGLLSLAVLLVSRLASRAVGSARPARQLALPYGPALAVGTLAALALR
jgi:prepilin peptidase CpaA